MSRHMVIDASAAIAWLLNENESAQQIGRLLSNSQLMAPWLWKLEIVNTILVYERRKLLDESQSAQMLLLVDELHIELVPEPQSRTASTLAQFARPLELSSYDATYLELAMARRLPLLTRDGNLRAAAKRSGVALV